MIFKGSIEKYKRWAVFVLSVKWWVLLFIFALLLITLALAILVLNIFPEFELNLLAGSVPVIVSMGILFTGTFLMLLALQKVSWNILAPYQNATLTSVTETVTEHNRKQRGIRVVAIGGGTGLPATLRGMKPYTSNITAIVTVADDGGSSGRLRRDLGVLPPGDLRNNIVALGDDENLLTKLFQYRFESGDLEGHAFGNLFIAALANVVEQSGESGNSLARAVAEIERVLNIQGRVLPATVSDINLTATMRLNSNQRVVKVKGESHIEEVDGSIDHIELSPSDIVAFEPSIQAILEADLVVIGPGSLYTSLLPNLLVNGIVDALRATQAYKIYVCNVATQPVETTGYNVADHIMALEKHIGRGVFQVVLANNKYPTENQGVTQYVMPALDNHEINQRYQIYYSDLTDDERPWRHDHQKLAKAILSVSKLDFVKTTVLKSAS